MKISRRFFAGTSICLVVLLPTPSMCAGSMGNGTEKERGWGEGRGKERKKGVLRMRYTIVFIEAV